jgi:hypothetical protein
MGICDARSGTGRPAKHQKKKFKTSPIGVFYSDIAEVETNEGKLSLYVAIERSSKSAFAPFGKMTGSACAFPKARIVAVPHNIPTGFHRQRHSVHLSATLCEWPAGEIRDLDVRRALPKERDRAQAQPRRKPLNGLRPQEYIGNENERIVRDPRQQMPGVNNEPETVGQFSRDFRPTFISR